MAKKRKVGRLKKPMQMIKPIQVPFLKDNRLSLLNWVVFRVHIKISINHPLKKLFCLKKGYLVGKRINKKF